MPVPPNALRSATYQASMSRSESQSPAYSPKLQPGLSSIFSRFTGRSRSSSSPAQHKKAIAANSPTSAATGNANGGIEDAKDRLASILASAKHHHQDPQNISSSSSSAKRKKGQTADVPPVFGAAADAELSDQGPYAPTSPFIILDLLSRTSKGDRSDERLACIQSLCDAVILFDEVDALQVWLSAPASALLDTAVEPVCVRLAGIRLLVTCISASESSLHLASRKIAYYNFICRYGKDSKDCSDEELEALTEALSVLCKGGRDVSALDGLVERICDFAGEKFKRRQAQRDQFRVEFFAKHPYFSRLLTDKDSQHINTPLLDPHHASVFVSWPVAAAEARTPGTSSLTLLTNIHKFSFPLLSEEAVAFSTAYLVAEALATSNDGIISRILEHMDSISKFGYVPTSQIQGVVFLLARIVATEGSQRHLCFIDDEGNELSEPVLKPLPPHLSNEAKRVINNLLRSTANQALAQLREGTKPPSSESSHDENVVVGCLKCLRLAMAEIRASMKHTSVEAAANSTYFDSWPIILSFGIPLFFNNMWDALDCPHPAVTLEVLHIITDRLVMLQEFESPHVLPDGGNETVFMNPRSISFEEWDMILDLFREVLRNIQRLEEDDKVLWILNLTAARPDSEPSRVFFEAAEKADRCVKSTKTSTSLKTTLAVMYNPLFSPKLAALSCLFLILISKEASKDRLTDSFMCFTALAPT